MVTETKSYTLGVIYEEYIGMSFPGIIYILLTYLFEVYSRRVLYLINDNILVEVQSLCQVISFSFYLMLL